MQFNFKTTFEINKPAFSITHKDVVMNMGSCFSENLGKIFSQYKFDILINPFGQQYNPLSISKAIERLLNPVPYNEKDLIYRDELFHSFDHHGDFSFPSSQETLLQINSQLISASEHLKRTSILFLTFGTAHAFKLRDKGMVVNNCHKFPSDNFISELINPKIVFKELSESFEKLWQFNPNIKIVLTVSPVRYMAFGVHENTVSKSYLFAAIQFLQEQFPQLYYFPSYEIVMDDLRDYRFYNDDLLHPNQIAIKYVWQQFGDAMFNQNTKQLISEMDEIISASNHKPRNPKSELHKKFVESVLKKMEMIENKSGLNFSEEKRAINPIQ